MEVCVAARIVVYRLLGWVVLLMRALAARTRDDNGADNVGVVVMQGKCGADLGTLAEGGEHLRSGTLVRSCAKYREL